MADNFFRLFRLLQLVPRAPRSIDAERLESILRGEGMDCSRRTIQRDLIELSRMPLGLECIDDSKPYRWRYAETAPLVQLPGFDPQAALALRLVEMHMERALPRSTVRALQPHLQAAKHALDGKPVARWLDRVRMVPRSQPLLPPKVDGGVTGVVHEALLEGRQIKARYRKRGETQAKELTLHPLGLIYRDSVGCLLATTFGYTDTRQYQLHRFVDAELLDDAANASPGFDIDDYIAKGEIDFLLGEGEIEVELRFDDNAAILLEETPLSARQELRRQADGRVVVRAAVPDTMVLRSWLLGFGGSVEVLRPKSLRDAIGEAHRTAAARYRAGARSRGASARTSNDRRTSRRQPRSAATTSVGAR
ncbi:MAG: WYL domain-containing protein [Deltaproteobacteria bacterium]|nr:WYL domain-containing protein [Deltaproteobacteria bacterium]